MSQEYTQSPAGPDRDVSSELTMAHVVYALYIASFVVGFSSIIGVIIAYVKRQDVRGTWLESHYTWQIRTFWWSLLIGGVGIILTLLLIGWVVLLGYVVFFIYRVVVGWVALSRRQPI